MAASACSSGHPYAALPANVTRGTLLSTHNCMLSPETTSMNLEMCGFFYPFFFLTPLTVIPGPHPWGQRWDYCSQFSQHLLLPHARDKASPEDAGVRSREDRCVCWGPGSPGIGTLLLSCQGSVQAAPFALLQSSWFLDTFLPSRPSFGFVSKNQSFSF